MANQQQEESLSRVERALEWPMLALTVAFIGALVVDLHPTASPAARAAGEGLEIGAWAGFAFEYLLLLALAHDRRRFLRTHVLEALVVLLPALRVFRLLRLLRLEELIGRPLAEAEGLGEVETRGKAWRAKAEAKKRDEGETQPPAQ